MEPTRDVMAVLSERGVIEEAGDDRIRPTAAFTTAVQSHSGASRPDIESVVEDEDELAALQDAYDATEAESVYTALTEFVPEVAEEARLRIALLLDGLVREPQDTTEIPDPFLPVPGEALPSLLAAYDRAIVYVWRHDCDPCELVREDLEVHCASTPDDLALLAVYGPASAEFLQREYEVAGGPTVLFVKNGNVDARLLGAQSRKTLGTLVEDLADESE